MSPGSIPARVVDRSGVPRRFDVLRGLEVADRDRDALRGHGPLVRGVRFEGEGFLLLVGRQEVGARARGALLLPQPVRRELRRVDDGTRSRGDLRRPGGVSGREVERHERPLGLHGVQVGEQGRRSQRVTDTEDAVERTLHRACRERISVREGEVAAYVALIRGERGSDEGARLGRVGFRYGRTRLEGEEALIDVVEHRPGPVVVHTGRVEARQMARRTDDDRFFFRRLGLRQLTATGEEKSERPGCYSGTDEFHERARASLVHGQGNGGAVPRWLERKVSAWGLPSVGRNHGYGTRESPHGIRRDTYR